MRRETGTHILRALGGVLLTVGLFLILGRCDLVEPTEPQPLVVEAFLKTDRPLPAITLRRTRPLDAPGRRDEKAAQGATVELVLGNRTVVYEADDSRPGRYVPGRTPETVPAGVSWALTARWRGEVARAQGRTPPPIDLKEVCVEVPEAPVQAVRVDSLRRDSLDIPAERGYLYPVDVSLTWPNGTGPERADTTHWVRPQLNPDTTESSSRFINFFLEPVDVRREDQFRTQNGQRAWRGVYAVPVEDSTSAFPGHDLTATLTRGDTAFAAFARSRDDPERREPISNVEGGLGVATAVAIDSLRRSVTSAGEQQCYVP
ncbi:MAG: DUF4249 family protein [Salinibacter sp.]|uniref:DUF4249 family protein n=1 Tax=Salinibacter sp. TaxID=2065818 RepID=UPI002FC2A448